MENNETGAFFNQTLNVYSKQSKLMLKINFTLIILTNK